MKQQNYDFSLNDIPGLSSDPPLTLWVKWKSPLNTKRLKSKGTGWLGATEIQARPKTLSSKVPVLAVLQHPPGYETLINRRWSI